MRFAERTHDALEHYVERGADDDPLRSRMFPAAGPLVDKRLHSIAERLAAEVDLPDDSFPWSVARAAPIGDEAAVRLMLLGASARPHLTERPINLEPLVLASLCSCSMDVRRA